MVKAKNMMKQIISILFTGLILAQGLSHPAQAAPQTALNLSGNVRVRFSGGRLEKELSASRGMTKPVGRLYSGSIALTNQSTHLYHLEYKADWEDADGRLVTTGRWRPFSLGPNMRKDLISTSKTPDAVSVIFSIRLPDDDLLNGRNLRESY